MERSAGFRSGSAHDGNPLGVDGDSVREPDVPTSLAFVHAENDAGIVRGVVNRGIEEQKPRTQLGNRHGMTVENQVDFHVSGVPTVTAGL